VTASPIGGRASLASFFAALNVRGGLDVSSAASASPCGEPLGSGGLQLMWCASDMPQCRRGGRVGSVSEELQQLRSLMRCRRSSPRHRDILRREPEKTDLFADIEERNRDNLAHGTATLKWWFRT